MKQEIKVRKNYEGFSFVIDVDLDAYIALEKVEEFLRGYKLATRDKEWNIPILSFYDKDKKSVVEIWLRHEEKEEGAEQ